MSSGRWSATASTSTPWSWIRRPSRKQRPDSKGAGRVQGNQPPGVEIAAGRRLSGHVQLLVSRERILVRRSRARCGARCARGGERGGKADAGERSPHRARHAGDVLSEVFYFKKACLGFRLSALGQDL